MLLDEHTAACMENEIERSILSSGQKQPAVLSSITLQQLLLIAPCKGIQDTLGFWIPRRGFRIPFTGFQIFFSGTWIPDSNC